MSARFLLCLLVTAGMLASEAACADVRVEAGDLLGVVQGTDRILHIVPQTEQVYDFSPRQGSGPNRLFQPNGIAIDPDGTVFVTNASGELISIDPSTGAQSVVRAFDILFGDFGPVDIGAAPRSIDISDYKASPSDRRDLYVLSADGIRRIDRAAGSLSSEILVAPDATIANAIGLSIADDATGPSSAWVATTTEAALYDFVGGLPSTYSLGATVGGIDFRGTASLGTLIYSRSFGFANSGNGVFLLLGPLSTGGSFFYPSAVATTPPSQPLVIYTAQLTSPPQIVAAAPSGSDYVQTPIVLGGESGSITAMAVSPAALPELGFGAGAFSACFALAALRARRAPRPRAAPRPAPART